MFVQSYVCYICQTSIKINTAKFLTSSKLFANFDFTTINVS